jgi:diguanylate cyclase (GGDEF)-like protein/PAS domain S-box-containing protein
LQVFTSHPRLDESPPISIGIPAVRVLLVDDDPVFGSHFAEALREAVCDRSIEIAHAADARAALALAGVRVFDLVFLDYELEEETGLDLLLKLRELGARAPAIMLTGRGDEAVAAEAMRSGAADYLSKTRLTLDSLAVCVRHGLEIGRREALQKATDAALAKSERRFRALVEKSSDGVAMIGADGKIAYVGPSTEGILGYPPDELVGRSVFEIIDADDRETMHEHFGELLQAPGQSRQAEYRIIRRDGTRRWIGGISTNLLDDSAVAAIVVNYRDITERKHEKEKTEFQARHDPLTHLGNRSLLEERLGFALEKSARTGHGFTIMFLDLDRLKAINDSLGHGVGDNLLRMVALRLKRCVRDFDTVSRIGGDEFVLLMPDLCARPVAEGVAQKILDRIAEPFHIDDRELAISTSIGIALHPEDGRTGEDLLAHADRALYRAKEAGGSVYRFFSDNN